MSSKSLINRPPRGLLRLSLRLPIVLYRARLGWLLGQRFILLNHVGRKSGQVRQTVVEVVGHSAGNDKDPESYYIVSAWGYHSGWYRNLLATPNITVKVGRRSLAVKAETLAPADAAQILLQYRDHHPLAARELSRVTGLKLGADASRQTLEEMIRSWLPMIALRVRNEKAPQHIT